MKFRCPVSVFQFRLLLISDSTSHKVQARALGPGLSFCVRARFGVKARASLPCLRGQQATSTRSRQRKRSSRAPCPCPLRPTQRLRWVRKRRQRRPRLLPRRPPRLSECGCSARRGSMRSASSAGSRPRPRHPRGTRCLRWRRLRTSTTAPRPHRRYQQKPHGAQRQRQPRPAARSATVQLRAAPARCLTASPIAVAADELPRHLLQCRPWAHSRMEQSQTPVRRRSLPHQRPCYPLPLRSTHR